MPESFSPACPLSISLSGFPDRLYVSGRPIGDIFRVAPGDKCSKQDREYQFHRRFHRVVVGMEPGRLDGSPMSEPSSHESVRYRSVCAPFAGFGGVGGNDGVSRTGRCPQKRSVRAVTRLRSGRISRVGSGKWEVGSGNPYSLVEPWGEWGEKFS